MSSLTFRRGRSDEWREILAVSEAGFGFDPGFFQKLVPNTYPGPEAAPWFVVAECRGRIVGVINFTPVPIRFGRRRLKAVGIGGVCVLKRYRKRGAMSGMLLEGYRSERAAGTHVGFLWGARARYGRYGYEIAGSQGCAIVSRTMLTPFPPVPIRKLTGTDAAAVARLSRRTGMSVHRPEAWQRLLMKWQRNVAYGNREGPLRAYFGTHTDNPGTVFETAGPSTLVLGMLRRHLRRKKENGVTIPLQPGSPAATFAWRHGHIAPANAAGQVGIYDFGRFLEGVSDVLARNFRAFGVASRVTVEHKDEKTRFDLHLPRRGDVRVTPAKGRRRPDVSLTALEWIRTLFPPPGATGPEKGVTETLAAAFRLPLFISMWDHL